MKKGYLSIILAGLLLCCYHSSKGQLVPPNAYLQGQYLEVGEYQNGGFGAPLPPAGYHPHIASGLSAVYDWGHDGWGVGTPTPYMGDYWLPGFAQEGWAIQAGAAVTAGTAYAPYAMTAGLGGGITGYASAGGVTTVSWSGTYMGLTINQVTRVDQFASWVVVTTTLTNGTGSPIPNVYYMRTCDPDNAATWASPTGGYTTVNTIVHQNDLDHRVQVSATDPGYGPLSTYSALCTKDCRAKAFICPTYTLQPSSALNTVYAGLGGYLYSGTNTNDCGIGLVWYLGSIAGGASAVISYAYVFDNDFGIDSALPDPHLVVNGDTVPDAPPTQITYDTINMCSLPPGTTTIPIDIAFGTDKDWTLSSWAWSPGTGLTTVTGVINTLDVTALTGPTTFTIVGNDSASGMYDCAHRVFMLTVIPCHTAFNNSPCEGDTLKLTDKGDSLGATYVWTGPLGFTSTKQSPFIYPAILADSGWYHVIKSISGVHDTDSTHVVIHPKPTITISNNSPLCSGSIDTLNLFASLFTAGETFAWTGPGGFSSAAENPTIVGMAPPATAPPPLVAMGTYTVVVTTPFGCKDTAYTNVDTITKPPAPIITDPTPYCQFETFVPFTVTGLDSGAVVWWYSTDSSEPGYTVPTPAINTSVPGNQVAWVSQKVGSCESPRASFTVHVTVTPPAPVVTYNNKYCQYIGPVDTIIATHTATGVLQWYMSASGGTPSLVQPIPNINVATTYTYWVSQIDSTCESPRTPITIIVHPKPNPPVIVPQWWCQFQTPAPDTATMSGPSTDYETWYGPGVTVGGSTRPVPNTFNAPDTIVTYVTETTMYGCVSDSAVDNVIIKVKPAPPYPSNTKYCQLGNTQPLNGLVDSESNSFLNWYYNTVPLQPPVYPLGMNPLNDTTPGSYTYYVAQTVPAVLGCESDSVPLTVTIIYKPVFGIQLSQPYVCQFDSITLSYSQNSPTLFAPGYLWTLPEGAYFADNTNKYDSAVIVKFDSAILNNYVHLTTSDDSGFCKSDTSIRINIVAQPVATGHSRADVCLGDTVTLALGYESQDAYSYTWLIDSILMANSPSVIVVAANSNSGGPFSISWVDSGRHILVVQSFSKEGCRAEPTDDTVDVHTIPDANFNLTTGSKALCLDDSVQLMAEANNYNYSYYWSPEHSFTNENTPLIWGRLEQLHSVITLTVTDPFGCVATESKDFNVQPCCTISFPNAFTPNGDNKNDFFEPVCVGYHEFHIFRVVNRWGQTVFETTNSSQARWDGNYNGVPQDMGTYYYYLKYDCGGGTMEQKGDLTLIR